MTTYATLHTNQGDIRIELFPNHAPKTVRNFVGLADGSQQWTDPKTGQKRSDSLYAGTVFHRVISGFMIQGGDPLGTGTGGPGYQYAGEFSPNVKHDRPYLLSMANAGPNTDGSQFFITFKATPWLDGKHTIFGEVVEGQDTVKKLEAAGSPQGKPTEELKIVKATIEEKAKG